MVYAWWPPLPGMSSEVHQVWQHGSDTAAMMMWGVPAGFVESRSLLEHGEIPLWNRYGHAGETLIGQAVSMLGDPLQLIVIFGRGSAGAWDTKFLAAKLLFCVGFGWLMLRLFGNQPLSLLYAALAAYCGAFFFINNHPVFFVFSYAPWILLAALAWLELESAHHVRWGLVWLLANFACFNAGYVEPAAVLIGGLNLVAVVLALTQSRTLAGAAKVLGRMAVGTLIFMGLTAPMWVSFLASLEASYTAHTEVRVSQLPLSNLPGMFDDLFYLLLNGVHYFAPAPGTSLLVLAGCILSGLNWRKFQAEPFFWVNGGAILLWTGCAFQIVPASWLEQIPLLNRVGHVYADFSYLLVIHLTIQSAYGFFGLAREKNFRRAAADFLWVILIFAGTFLAYDLAAPHRSIPWNYFLCAAAGAVGAPWLFAYLKSRSNRISAVGWLGITLLGFIPQYRFGLYDRGNPEYALFLPGPRTILDAPSRSIDWIKADFSGPFRVVGMDWNFFGNYAAVYGLEDVRSCAPLSNPDFIRVVAKFPGMEMDNEWMIRVMDPVAAQPLLSMLNVKYVLTHPSVNLQEGLVFRLADRSDFAVLENQEVWPRAFFTDKIVASESNGEFIKQLLANGKNPFIALTKRAIETQPGLQKLAVATKATVSPATNYELLPNSTAFDVHAAAAGVVCLTEGQASDFTALANGAAKPVLTVNRAFKGIYLDKPGDYHVVFTYRPRHWRQSCIAFWIAAGSVIVLVLAELFRQRVLPAAGQPTNQK